MKRSIVWFKTDLRLEDNETLVKAVQYSDEVLPVYVLEDSLFETTFFGTNKIGNFRYQFLCESLKDLDANLRKIGSGLLVVRGKAEIELPKLVRQFNINVIYSKKEVAPEERSLDQKVEKAVWKDLCLFEQFSTSTLYHALDLPFPVKKIPDVFTSFRKKIEKETSVRGVFPKPKVIKSPTIHSLVLPDYSIVGLTKVEEDKRSAVPFKGGETEALKRLNYYLFEEKLISNYKNTRNELIGKDYSSKLSLWLSNGCISPRMIYSKVKQYEEEVESNDSTYWLIFELVWRDYFRFMVKKHRNSYFLKSGIKDKGDYISNNFDQSVFDKWKSGNTGNLFIDANMKELKLSGYMSNRGRQIVASYFCNELEQDWRYGAAYFEEQLMDYDVCSNWGNWSYIAGVGNDPRGKRIFNIEKQVKDYDPLRRFQNLWLEK
jgi:deoxyribodipyrimidine photo-lyase